MNTCQLPECGKEIPEGKHYCNEECLRRHQEIKKEQRSPQHSSKSGHAESEIRLEGVPDEVITNIINLKIPISRVAFGGTMRRINQMRFVAQILYLMNGHMQEEILSQVSVMTGMTKFKCGIYLDDLETDYRLIKRSPSGKIQFNGTTE